MLISHLQELFTHKSCLVGSAIMTLFENIIWLREIQKCPGLSPVNKKISNVWHLCQN